MCKLSSVLLLPFQAARSHFYCSYFIDFFFFFLINVYLSAMYGGCLLFFIYTSFLSHGSDLLLIILLIDIYGVLDIYISCYHLNKNMK